VIVSADSRGHVRLETKFFGDGVEVSLPLRVLQAAKHELIVSVGRGRHLERGRRECDFDVGEWLARFWRPLLLVVGNTELDEVKVKGSGLKIKVGGWSLCSSKPR
jgi:hypothetical protein